MQRTMQTNAKIEFDMRMPSLEQEMNLARRACWCYNHNKQDEQQHAHLYNNVKLQHMQHTIQQQQQQQPQQQPQQQQQKCCENEIFNYIDVVMPTTSSSTIATATIATTTATATATATATTDPTTIMSSKQSIITIKNLTVLNGANNFSKFFNNPNYNNNNNNINNHKNIQLLDTKYFKMPAKNCSLCSNASSSSSNTTEHQRPSITINNSLNNINVNEMADFHHPNSTMNYYTQGYDVDDQANDNDNADDDDDDDKTTIRTIITTITTTTKTIAATIVKRNNNNILTVKSKSDNYNNLIIKYANNHEHYDNNNHRAVAYLKLIHFWCILLQYCVNYVISLNHIISYVVLCYHCKHDISEHPEEKVTRNFMRPTKKSSCKLLSFLCIYLFLMCVDGRPDMDITNHGNSDTITNSMNVGANKMAEASKAMLDALDRVENSQQTLPYVENVKQIPKNEDLEELKEAGADDEHKHERYPLSQVDFERVKTPFIIGIWILSASVAKIGFHMTPKLHLIFPESCLLIVVGVAIGVVLYFSTSVGVSPLTPNTFFFYMLPPIILDAGYFMPNRLFFDNLGTILLMAVVGTIFNIATIGASLWACGTIGIFGSADETPKLLDTFLFSSLISAVDPVAVLAVFEEIHVNEILYIVVFGESLLNDAVTVVMYHMMEVYNEMGLKNIEAQDIASGVGSFFVVALGGTVIGIIWGFLTGLVTRFTDHVRVIEPIFIFVMAYLAYLNAEIFHMSGIMAITFCGITMKNYVESNISQKSHTTVKYALKMLSSSSETIIFMFLGVATVDKGHDWNTFFVLLTILFCSVFRVIGVIILSALANRFRLHKLSRVDQFVMSYGGLRGAVAFALVLLIDENVVPQKNMFVTTTIAVIYFTVFVQGITIKPLVKILNVKRANKRKPTMNERIHERFMDHLMAGVEDIVGKTGNYNVRDKFKRFDNRFIRPLLIRDLKQGAEPKIIETYSKLTMRDAIEVMRRNPSTIGQITGTESMSALFRNYTNNCIGGSPSLTNLDNNCSRNLDMHELDYNPSKKDLTDAKIHHLLAEELKPYRRHRRLSYSRHAVDDRDLSTQVNYKMQMHFRRMFNDRKHYKRSKRGVNKHHTDGGVKQSHVSFHDFQQNGTTKQYPQDEDSGKLTEVMVVGASDDWDDGLTFTAKSSSDSDRANNNSLIAHIQNLPGFDASKARIVQHYSTTAIHSGGNAAMPSIKSAEDGSPEKSLSPELPITPTAAELSLPWRRDRSYQSYVVNNVIPEEERNVARDSDGEHRVATPTATESQLPWKRQGDELSDAVQQNEFPAWASNKEYLAYNSPSATFLGGINKPKQHKSVIGLFRRESSGSRGTGGSLVGETIDAGSAPGSDPALAVMLSNMVNPPPITINQSSRMDKRSQSISAASNLGDGHAGPFPVTASHRRNTRRGSMLELSGDIIPEESYYHGHSKSLCEPQGEEWESALTNAERTQCVRPHSERLLRGSTREPLLSKLTPRAQLRRGLSAGSTGFSIAGGNANNKSKVTTALLSTSYSDYDDEEDDDEGEEDKLELYDEDNLIVTTTVTSPTTGATIDDGSTNTRSINNRTEGGPITTTTTTVRLIRKNDESII